LLSLAFTKVYSNSELISHSDRQWGKSLNQYTKKPMTEITKYSQLKFR
jgi:hypothetical protein